MGFLRNFEKKTPKMNNYQVDKNWLNLVTLSLTQLNSRCAALAFNKCFCVDYLYWELPNLVYVNFIVLRNLTAL
jgi:hypothetical protein